MNMSHWVDGGLEAAGGAVGGEEEGEPARDLDHVLDDRPPLLLLVGEDPAALTPQSVLMGADSVLL